MLQNSKMKGVIFRSWRQLLKVLIIKGNLNLKIIQKNLTEEKIEVRADRIKGDFYLFSFL